MIDPNAISTIRVEQLASAPLNLTDNIPHEVAGVLKRTTVQDLVDFVSTQIEASIGSAYLPLALTDGGQLPTVPVSRSFLISPKGTYLNVNGYSDIVADGELNILMSLEDHWELAVQIPIAVDPVEIGISQTINSGVTNFAPSENAVYNALNQYLNSVGSFHYADLATQTTPLTVVANVPLKLLNDAEGTQTNVSNAPYGVGVVWDETNNQINLSALSVGDLVHLRIDTNLTTGTANQTYRFYANMAIGSGNEWTLDLMDSQKKTSGLVHSNAEVSFDIANEDTRDFPAEIYVVSDGGGTIKINGWYFEIIRKNINVIDIDGLTDLSVTRTPTNVTIESSTGTDAVIGLGDGTNAGVSLNDYTTAEKSKLADTYITSEVDDFLDLKANITNTLQEEDTTSGTRILVLTDAGTTIQFNLNGVVKTVTVPTNSSVAFPIGTTIGLYNANIGGTQQVVISGAGVTFINNDNNLRAGDFVILLKTKTNTWIVLNTLKTYPIFTGTVSSTDTLRAFRSNENGSFCFSDGVSGMKGNANSQVWFDSWVSTTNLPLFNFIGQYLTQGSGVTNIINFSDTVNPAGGTAVFNSFNLSPIINQTGGANGITRGLYINPTLTSAVDFRAIEVTAGKSMFQEVIANNIVRLKNYTVATLPTGVQGDTAYVTDALLPTYLGTAVGGGAVVCKVFFNGTNWIT
jgi:DNA-binding sugar fermentation-stimulating protein